MKVNDIVQVGLDHEWVGCLVVVTEVKTWGIQGYVQVPMQGAAYVRLKNEDFEKVGEAVYTLK